MRCISMERHKIMPLQAILTGHRKWSCKMPPEPTKNPPGYYLFLIRGDVGEVIVFSKLKEKCVHYM